MDALRATSTDVVLRLRSFAQEELSRTPQHLFPLSHEALRRRLDIFDGELRRREEERASTVMLRRLYDPEAPLETQLEPRPR